MTVLQHFLEAGHAKMVPDNVPILRVDSYLEHQEAVRQVSITAKV